MEGRANFLPYLIGADGKLQLALPSVLAGAVNAVTAPYRAMNPQDYPDFNTEQEAADFAFNMLGGGTVFGRAPKNALGMNVYHGSPHKFKPTELNDLGEFDASKIGTGEGAQAYGAGSYLADNAKVAGSYRESLTNLYGTPTTIDGGGESVPIPLWLANKIKQGGSVDTAIAEWTQRAAESRAAMKSSLQPWIQEGNAVRFEDELKNLHAIKASEGGKVADAGSLYKVDLPDEQIAKMLDWDKPLSEQSEAVKKALRNSNGLFVEKGGEFFHRLPHESRKLATGQDLLNRLVGRGKNVGNNIAITQGEGWGRRQADASAILKELGIPGIRYLDGDSRGAGGGTSNYVVFPGNEHMLTILERNGQAASPESQAIARYREIKGPKSVVRMEAALRTAGVPLPKNEPVAYIQGLVDRAHRRN